MEPMIVVERLRSSKDRLRDLVEKALYEIGLHDDLQVASVSLRLKKLPLRCPPGQVPVWETTTKPDGTIVSEWICKQDA
jgi:hypothetical protein